MKCNHCAGTFEDCGCGLGYCSHCNKGEVADWPFNITEDDLVIVDHAYDAMFDIFQSYKDLRTAIIKIGQSFMDVTLSDADIDVLEAFYKNRYRNTNIGQFSAIVGYRAFQIAKQIYNSL